LGGKFPTLNFLLITSKTVSDLSALSTLARHVC